MCRAIKIIEISDKAGLSTTPFPTKHPISVPQISHVCKNTDISAPKKDKNHGFRSMNFLSIFLQRHEGNSKYAA
jgi:hypothetical protein